MKLYHELATWWPLLSAPADYAEEAELYWRIISQYKPDIEDALELGSGGGNNAFHLKKKCRFILTDISPEMIRVSRELNPDCEHFVGDMRGIGLNRQFDLVFIHDAIMFITTEEDLEKVFRTARKHLKPGGLLFIAPDFFKETFRPSTSHGGHDDGHRSIRYLEWTQDADPADNLFETEYAYLLRGRRKISSPFQARGFVAGQGAKNAHSPATQVMSNAVQRQKIGIKWGSYSSPGPKGRGRAHKMCIRPGGRGPFFEENLGSFAAEGGV